LQKPGVEALLIKNRFTNRITAYKVARLALSATVVLLEREE